MANSERAAEKEAYWRGVLEQHRRSGLSVRSFCEQKGITEQSFYGWRKKLRNRDAEREVRSHRSDYPQQQTLIPVNVVDRDGCWPSAAHQPGQGNPTPGSPWLEVITPHGVTVRLHRHIDPQQLDLLMTVLWRGPDGGSPAC